MKKPSWSSVGLLAVMSTLLFIVFWAVWSICYPHFIVWLEGYSFFSTLPDFTSLYGRIQEGIPGYIGAFLHQFYSRPVLGAAIQAFIAVWPVICTGVMIIRLFDRPERILWLAFLPLPIYVYRQFWDLHMYYGIIFFFVFGALMLAVLAGTMIRRPSLKLPSWLGNIWVNAMVILVSVSVSVFFLVGMDPRNKEHEQIAQLEQLAEKGEWKEILDIVSVADARKNEFKRRYALLALSETGLLADHAFRYGLSGSDGFLFYDSVNPLCLSFNAIFYQSLDMHNATIHQTYQQGVQSVPGVGFSSLRRLADTYIKLRDYTLAKKYIDILSHSTCHKSWVNERLQKLEAIRNMEPAYEHDPFKAAIADFPHTISSMVDRNPENRQYADLLLCSLLAAEEGDKFKNLFRYVAQWQYPEGTPIPCLYEEALILISMVDPLAVQGFTISEDTAMRFEDYVSLMNSGRGNQALKKYADTYWAYSYRVN